MKQKNLSINVPLLTQNKKKSRILLLSSPNIKDNPSRIHIVNKTEDNDTSRSYRKLIRKDILSEYDISLHQNSII